MNAKNDAKVLQKSAKVMQKLGANDAKIMRILCKNNAQRMQK